MGAARSPAPAFDLRLLGPALTAWAAQVVLVVHGARTQLIVAVVCLALATLPDLVSRREGRRPSSRVAPWGGRWWGRHGGLVALTLAATALVLVAGAAHRATDETGPVPELARERAVVRVSGTVLTEPRLVVRGDERPDLVVLVRRVQGVDGGGSRSRLVTPVVVFADGSWQDVRWRTTVTARARLGPPEPGDSAAAVLTPLDPPTVEQSQSAMLAGTEHVRERLRAS